MLHRNQLLGSASELEPAIEINYSYVIRTHIKFTISLQKYGTVDTRMLPTIIQSLKSHTQIIYILKSQLSQKILEIKQIFGIHGPT